jgi:hypothetical protein
LQHEARAQFGTTRRLPAYAQANWLRRTRLQRPRRFIVPWNGFLSCKMKRFFNGEIAFGFALGCCAVLATIVVTTAISTHLGNWFELSFTDLSAHARDALNSVFITSVAGALAGAFFGAYAAQRIAERTKNRGELLKEMRNTNAAISLVFNISNITISIKKQHTKPIKDSFDELRSRIASQLAERKTNPAAQLAIHHIADFKSLSPVSLPLLLLQEHCFSNLSLGTKALSLVSMVTGSADSLNQAIVGRNRLIEFVKSSEFSNEQILLWHFGFEYAPGNSNNEYHDTLQAIYLLTDDIIFLSQKLSEELVSRAEQIEAEYKKKASAQAASQSAGRYFGRPRRRV